MTRVLLVSNGHGEDTIAASVGCILRAAGIAVAGLPLVGEGHAYDRAAIDTFGPRHALPSGGYTLHRASNAWNDLRAGLAPVTGRAWLALRRQARDAHACLVVGDAYALTCTAALAGTPRHYLPSAMSVRAWPPDAPPWSRPFGPLEQRLMRRSATVFARDEATAAWLREREHRNVHDLGNPMLDAVYGNASVPAAPPYLVLLPGTRGDAYRSLPVMLTACRELRDLDLRFGVAWAAAAAPPAVPGWRWIADGEEAVAGRYRHDDGTTVFVARGAFGTLLRGARGALATSGTAAEQFAGHGVPLVGFVTGGPQYTATFAAAQRRSLRAALDLAPADGPTVAQRMRTFLADAGRVRAARRDGAAAMGAPGAAGRIAAHVTAHLGLRPAPRKEAR